jgi:hypothetical protein
MSVILATPPGKLGPTRFQLPQFMPFFLSAFFLLPNCCCRLIILILKLVHLDILIATLTMKASILSPCQHTPLIFNRRLDIVFGYLILLFILAILKYRDDTTIWSWSVRKLIWQRTRKAVVQL